MSKHGKAKVLTETEFKRVISVQRGKEKFSERNVAILYVSFFLGFRAKEIASLKMSDIVDSKHKLKTECTLSKTKGDRVRQFYITNPKLIKALEDYLSVRNSNNPYVFVSNKGGAFTPNTMQMLIKRCFVDAGIEGASSHSGRRSFATKLITEKGVDIKTVSTLMGHSSITTTAIYAETDPEKMKNIAASL